MSGPLDAPACHCRFCLWVTILHIEYISSMLATSNQNQFGTIGLTRSLEMYLTLLWWHHSSWRVEYLFGREWERTGRPSNSRVHLWPKIFDIKLLFSEIDIIFFLLLIKLASSLFLSDKRCESLNICIEIELWTVFTLKLETKVFDYEHLLNDKFQFS